MRRLSLVLPFLLVSALLPAAAGGAAPVLSNADAPGDALPPRAKAAQAGVAAMPSGRTTYREPADYTAELDRLVATYPGVVRRLAAPGRSVQGRPIEAVELAGGVGRAGDGRPVWAVFSLVHAREWASGEVMMELLGELAAGYGRDARITALLDRVRVVAVPVVNPDGFLTSRGAAEGDQFHRFWRKNANRVDLNRNAGAFWGGEGASPSRLADDHRGPRPWSEPESRAMRDLLAGLPVTVATALHNVVGLVIHGPGDANLPRTPDEDLVAALGRQMGSAAGYKAGPIPKLLYSAMGGIDEWTYVAMGALSHTVELDGDGFFGAYQGNAIDQYFGVGDARGGTREALLRAAEAAGDPARHGVLTGSAPPGARLRAARRFLTATSPRCPGKPQRITWGSCDRPAAPQLLDETVAATLDVGPDGRVEWHLGPSTRPFEALAGRSEAWTVTCAAGGRVVGRHDVVLERGKRLAVDFCRGGAVARGTALAKPSRELPRVVLAASRTSRSALASRGVRATVSCPASCRARVMLVADGKPVATKVVRLAAGRRRAVRLRASRSRVARADDVAVAVLDGAVRVERPVRITG